MSRVKPEGRNNAKFILVGEAPGATEVQKNRPFVGKAGQLLDRLILGTSGISRSDCYITNVVKERPPNNDISKFIKFDYKGRPIETEEFQEYRKELVEELNKVDAHVIIALGKVPLYALTGKTHITKERGSLLEPLSELGLKDKIILPCIHPAAALRQYIFTIMILLDLQRAVSVANTPFKNIDIDQRKLHSKIKTYPAVDEAISWLKQYSKKSKDNNVPLAFDIEVINLETASVGFAYVSENEVSAICIAFKEYKDLFNPDSETVIMKEIGKVLHDEKVKKVGQNLMFDNNFLFRKYGIVVQNFEDTMIAQAILTPDLPKGLDFICSVYTNIPYYKDEGKIWKGLGGNYEEFWLYNGKDCLVCSIAWPKLKEDLIKQGNWDTYVRQRNIVTPMIWAQNRGIKVDLEGLKKAYADTEVKLAELQEKLNALAGKPLNPNSPKQLKTYFYIEKGYPPYKKGGKITTDELAMKRLSRKGCKEADIVVEMRKIRKLRGTYYDPTKIDLDSRLRTTFKPVGTLNGRMSSSETIFGTGMNVQNLPGVMKKYLLFDDNYIGYQIDLGQAENRLVAYLSGEYAMINAFEKGIDIHSQTGAMIYTYFTGEKATVEDIRRWHKEGKTAPLGNGTRSWRYWGKKANHGLNYDEGYRTFSLDNEIPEKEGKLVVNTYHKIYPEIHSWHRRIRTQLSKNRTLTNPFGRKRRFLDRWGDQMFKQAYNFIPQSTVADIINLYGVDYIWKETPSYVELLNQVHDSIVFQIPVSVPFKEHAVIIRKIVKSLETPVKLVSRDFIIPAELEIGFNFKDMEEVPVDNNLEKNIERIWNEKKTN